MASMYTPAQLMAAAGVQPSQPGYPSRVIHSGTGPAAHRTLLAGSPPSGHIAQSQSLLRSQKFQPYSTQPGPIAYSSPRPVWPATGNVVQGFSRQTTPNSTPVSVRQVVPAAPQIYRYASFTAPAQPQAGPSIVQAAPQTTIQTQPRPSVVQNGHVVRTMPQQVVPKAAEEESWHWILTIARPDAPKPGPTEEEVKEASEWIVNLTRPAGGVIAAH
mmetsp:Transcript_32760/g.76549  ORF Transcript_32760/g.76549 Transcript_32760/m.76549 type:complete len:216 (-) Transcript_32760:182-829(-)